jgi:hypothetical protein
MFQEMLPYFKGGAPLASAFGCRVSISVGSQSIGKHTDFLSSSTTDLTAVCHELQYMELRSRGSASWARRRIGVYQQVHPSKNRHIAILLHMSRKPRIFERLITHEGTHDHSHDVQSISRRPFCLHALVISCYLRNWREYLKQKEENCVAKVSRIALASTGMQSIT